MPRSFPVLGLVALVGLSFAGSQAFARGLIPVIADPAPAKGIIVTVRDDHGAVSGARVIVETQEGKLLADGTADADGRYSTDISDEALNIAVNVTAAAPGHAAVSFLANVAHRLTLELPLDPVDAYTVFSGKLTGFKDSDDDSKAQAGIVAKALSLDDLASLDTSSIVSPLSDQIDLLGSRNIPSNVVLPDQTFPIYIVPIHVEKPTYRLPVLSGTSNRYFGLTGAISVQDAVNALQAKKGWDIINTITFQKTSLSAPITAQGQNMAVDFVTDTDIQQTVSVHPGKNTTSGDSHRLAVALWEPTPGLFVPSDIKTVGDTDVTLATVDPAHARLMDVLIGSGGRYRGQWVAAGSTLPDAGITADLTVDKGLNGTWLVSGGESAQLMVAHAEEHVTNSVGAGLYVDRWLIVGPRRAPIALPAAARAALPQLGKISHVSVDLLQTAHAGYPFFSGETASSELTSFEKVRKELK